MICAWEPPSGHGRVMGGLLGVLAGEASGRSDDWYPIGEAQPVASASIDIAHGYVATRGQRVPVAIARRHRGVTGPGWLMPVALVRSDAPSRVSDTLVLAEAAGVPRGEWGSCVAYVELASRALAGTSAQEAVQGMVPDPATDNDEAPRLSGNAVLDGLRSAVWALTRPLPLTDVVVLLRQAVPPHVTAAACGVLGLHYGADAMPRRWQQRLPRAGECVALTPALLRARGVLISEQPPSDRGDRHRPRLRLLPPPSTFPTSWGSEGRPASDTVALHHHLHDRPHSQQEDRP